MYDLLLLCDGFAFGVGFTVVLMIIGSYGRYKQNLRLMDEAYDRGYQDGASLNEWQVEYLDSELDELRDRIEELKSGEQIGEP